MKNLIIILVTTMTLAACNNKAETARAVEAAKKATLDSINAINTAKQKAIDSMKHVQHMKQETAAVAPAENAPVAKKKKKWSHTAKGAVVGAAGGAITGAIVNKDRAKGAVIGTLIGAGAGAATGAIVDSKERKKKAQ